MSAKENSVRKIIHVDMDAFFAAVEIRDNPRYKGKPLIVGGSPKSRGVVSTCSYEARKYGIHSAMPSATAYRLCPHAIFVHGRYQAYREVSEQVREIFYEYTDLVEPVSIDEAYLDVTVNKKNISSATTIAREIKEKIKEKTNLTASAGISYNKFLAKIGSDLDKPNGLVVIPPDKAMEVLMNLPIGKFHGIGKVSEQKMKSLGINNGADLKRRTLKELLRHFGKVGNFYYQIVRGKDDREVKTNRIRKSIGMERTFSEDLDNTSDMLDYLKEFSKRLCLKMQERGIKGRTITLKIKYGNFDLCTRSLTFLEPVNNEKISFYYLSKLLKETLINNFKVRLLGLSFSNLKWDKETKIEQMEFGFFYHYPATLEK